MQKLLLGGVTIIAWLGAVATFIVTVSWLLARLWCKPKRKKQKNTPARFKLRFEQIEFSSHGIPIKGWFIPAIPDSSPSPGIVVVHGWSSNAADMLPTAHFLHEAGFAVLVYDARGHGESGEDGPITIRKFAEDIIAGIQFLGGRTEIDPKRLGVLGFSMGAAAAILASSIDRRIRAVVSCSAFSNPRVITEEYLAKLHIPSWPFRRLVFYFIERWLGTSMDNVAPRNRVGLLKADLLILHGDSDRYVSPTNAELLAVNAVRELTKLIIIPHRDHFDILRDSTCREEIITFLQKSLSPRSELKIDDENSYIHEFFHGLETSRKMSCC